MDNIQVFLEKSLLPAVVGLLDVSKNMAAAQSKEHGAITMTLAEEKAKTSDMEKALITLNESVAALGRPITQLVEAVNESNRLQMEQNARLQELSDAMADNTARLDVMNLSVSHHTGDPGTQKLLDALRAEGA